MRARTFRVSLALLAAVVASSAAVAKQPPVMPKGLPAFGADKPLPVPTIVGHSRSPSK